VTVVPPKKKKKKKKNKKKKKKKRSRGRRRSRGGGGGEGEEIILGSKGPLYGKKYLLHTISCIPEIWYNLLG